MVDAGGAVGVHILDVGLVSLDFRLLCGGRAHEHSSGRSLRHNHRRIELDDSDCAPGTGSLGGISCPATTTCFAVSASPSPAGPVIATTNSGSTWSVEKVPFGLGALVRDRRETG
jgi:hypothetical protein